MNIRKLYLASIKDSDLDFDSDSDREKWIIK